MEDTHLTNRNKISHLMIPLTLAFFWAFRVGHWIHKTEPIKLKKHMRKAFSIFRLGLDALTKVLNSSQSWLVSVLSIKDPDPPSKRALIRAGLI